MNKLKETLAYILTSSRKAVVGFLVTFVVGMIARVGIELEPSSAEALRSFFEALAVGFSVWLVRNK
jgi:ABC-type nitrate/sulfonate/bicarbonate transport system permease component